MCPTLVTGLEPATSGVAMLVGEARFELAAARVQGGMSDRTDLLSVIFWQVLMGVYAHFTATIPWWPTCLFGGGRGNRTLVATSDGR